jgi:hypothetical protein
MRRLLLGAAVLLVFLPAVPAQDDSKNKPPTETPQQQYQKLSQEYNRETSGLLAKLRQTYAPKFLELAEKNPKDPAAFDAIGWILNNAATDPQMQAQKVKALDLLAQNHLQSEKLGPFFAQFGAFGEYRLTGRVADPASEKLLRAILEKSPHQAIQGQACFALAQYLKNLSEHGRPTEPEKVTKEAEELFERVINQYADVRDVTKRNLASLAKPLLQALRFLAIGKPAPEIEAADLGDVKFKLSEYRGKVVLLDFWGHW